MVPFRTTAKAVAHTKASTMRPSPCRCSVGPLLTRRSIRRGLRPRAGTTRDCNPFGWSVYCPLPGRGRETTAAGRQFFSEHLSEDRSRRMMKRMVLAGLLAASLLLAACGGAGGGGSSSGGQACCDPQGPPPFEGGPLTVAAGKPGLPPRFKGGPRSEERRGGGEG